MKNQLNTYLVPKNKKNYLGIEIEFSCPLPREQLVQDLSEAGLQKYVDVGYDADAEEHHESYELRVLVDQNKLYEVISKVGRVLDSIGATTNDSCGLHVHLDMRHRNAAKAYRNLFQCQDLLFDMSHPRRRKSVFCKTMTVDNINLVEDSHYNAISPRLTRSKNTIEVRIREGIVDSFDIYNWCMLLVQIVDHAPIQNKNSKGQFNLNLYVSTIEYISSFSKQLLKRKAA